MSSCMHSYRVFDVCALIHSQCTIVQKLANELAVSFLISWPTVGIVAATIA